MQNLCACVQVSVLVRDGMCGGFHKQATNHAEDVSIWVRVSFSQNTDTV